MYIKEILEELAVIENNDQNKIDILKQEAQKQLDSINQLSTINSEEKQDIIIDYVNDLFLEKGTEVVNIVFS